MSPELIALHLGAMHPYEKVLTLLLAFGPFIVLGAVIAVRRRHEAGDQAGDQAGDGADGSPAVASRPGPDRPTAP
ncbi:MAG TPA: hypothetical protein VFV89_15060 [Nocardioides sp.]|uniref:hypothetical protein n=1 Tax=Nocardioides sp. TaxID=35761 RepID=UPI002E32EFAE|nr:hypothetical protein [Nocardioides sp.]HEX5089126.1 hypothetical protein [Nocardioides sp.]